MKGKRFVVDNSVVMAWALDEEDAYSDAVMGLMGKAEILAPGIWPLEAANAILTAVRRGRLSVSDGARLKALVEAMPITIVSETPARVFGEVFAVGLSSGLSIYDASYLGLAMREGLPLATVDTALRHAARRVGVRVLPSPPRKKDT